MMSQEIEIVRIDLYEYQELCRIAEFTFRESHGHSADPKDIDAYVSYAFNEQNIFSELSNLEFLYYWIQYKNISIGFIKLTPNKSHSLIASNNMIKLDRLYILSQYTSLGIGKYAMSFISNFAIESGFESIYLYVWIENQQALQFYISQGFQIVGEEDFIISDTHKNPNYIMEKILSQ